MPSTSPVISRLQNQRSRIQGMLSPGKKLRQPGELLHVSLSPVASDFAGRKFQLAARKMRSLDAGKLGKTLSGGLTSLSTDIHSKFAEIQKIIHINPGTARHDKSIWSSLETPLPETKPDRQETSLDPGLLRSGSIIQKMSTVPQPGQSLDSFKELVQKQPHTTRSSLDKKPVMDKNTRRFSQVQEVTPGQKLTPPEVPAVPVKPDESQSPVIESREASETATIQPQPDPTGSVPDKTVITSRVETSLPKPSKPSGPPEFPAHPEKKDSLPEMPLRAQPRASQPVTRAEQQTPPDEVADQPSDLKFIRPTGGQKDGVRVPDTQTGQPSQVQLPTQEKEIFKALPVAKKPPVQDELKKALPVKKEQKEPQKPVARPALKSSTGTPAQTAPPAIQRQPDADVTPSAPVRSFTQSPTDTDLPAAPVRPAIQQASQTTGPRENLPEIPAPAETETSRADMPLRQNMDYRKNAPRSLRAIDSQQMKPADQLPLLHREDKPLLTRSKYRATSSEASPPVLSTRNEPALFKQRDQPVFPPGIPAVLPEELPKRSLVPQAPIPQNLLPIPMPLASPIAAPAPAKQPPQPESVISPVQLQVAQTPRPTPTLTKTNNTIQRTWEGHTPPAQTSSGKSGGDKDRSESTDLQTLAENVFPYVKRILEIEANRSSGKLS